MRFFRGTDHFRAFCAKERFLKFDFLSSNQEVNGGGGNKGKEIDKKIEGRKQ